MKKIYFLFLLINVLVIYNISAQKQWCNTNYTLDTISYNPVVPYDSGTQILYNVYAETNVPNMTDSLSSVIPIGFNFNFYGNNYNSLLISPNGYLTFDTTLERTPSIPCGYFPLNSICLFEQGLDVETFGTVKWITIGTSPNRQFIVSFDSVATPIQLNDSGSHDQYSYFIWSYCTGQIVLYETTSIIERYISRAIPGLACGFFQGISNDAGTLRLVNDVFNAEDQNLGLRLTQNNLPNPNPNPICMVGVDSATGKNMVIWNKGASGVSGVTGASIDSFIIYKETNVAGVYAQIGEQPYSAFSTFIDTGSVPAQQANRYKLGFQDSCGVVSASSAAHKTVHLSISQGIGNTWNLMWDAYEGFTFGSYTLYRGTTTANMDSLTTIASTLFSYTDLSPPGGTVYYMIGVDNPDPCTPARISSGGGAFSSSLSNIVSNHQVGFASYNEDLSITISPNPASTLLTIHISSSYNWQTATVSIMNVLGQEATTQSTLQRNGADAVININELSAGIYFLQLKSENGSVVKKFVKE